MYKCLIHVGFNVLVMVSLIMEFTPLRRQQVDFGLIFNVPSFTIVRLVKLKPVRYNSTRLLT